MALRALAGLSPEDAAEGMMDPPQFKSAITMMSKAALCAWWHAKIMRHSQDLTLLSVRHTRLISGAGVPAYHVVAMRCVWFNHTSHAQHGKVAQQPEFWAHTHTHTHKSLTVSQVWGINILSKLQHALHEKVVDVNLINACAVSQGLPTH